MFWPFKRKPTLKDKMAELFESFKFGDIVVEYISSPKDYFRFVVNNTALKFSIQHSKNDNVFDVSVYDEALGKDILCTGYYYDMKDKRVQKRASEIVRYLKHQQLHKNQVYWARKMGVRHEYE